MAAIDMSPDLSVLIALGEQRSCFGTLGDPGDRRIPRPRRRGRRTLYALVEERGIDLHDNCGHEAPGPMVINGD